MVVPFLLAGLFSTPSFARERPTVAFVGVHDSGLSAEEQRALTDRVLEAIKDTKRFEPFAPNDVALAIAGRESIVLEGAFLTPGRRLLEDGRILHDQAQPEEAVPVLEQAIQGLEAGMPAANATRELWEAYLYLGSAHLSLKDQEAADAAWSAAVALSPERQPDAARIAPQVVQAYRTVQNRVSPKTGSISVKVEGPAAQVVVNDRAPTSAPARIAENPQGKVHVRARADSGAMAYAAAEVVAGEDTEVLLTLGDVALPAAGESAFARKRGATDLYKALGQQAKPDLLLIAGGSEGTAWLQLYAPAADTFSRPLDIAYEDTLDDEVLAALGDLLEVAGDDGDIPSIATAPTAAAVGTANNALLSELLLDPKPIAPAASNLKWWHLAAGGAGAVVVGGGLTAWAIVGGRSPDQGTIIVGPVPE